MTRKTSHRATARERDARAYYAPDLLDAMQRLLAALADLDRAYDSDVETVRSSNVPEIIKQSVVQTLEQRHQERRAPLVRQLERLQRLGLIRD
jgi:hypothetical protein